jgi:hypothetical protein
MNMSNAAAWAMLVGLAIPFATGLLVKASWPAWSKALVTVIFSAAVGFGTIWVAGSLALSWTNVLVTVAAVVGAATVSFRYIVDRVPGLKDFLYSVWVKDPVTPTAKD